MSNFKPGDRVAVYFYNSRMVGTVKEAIECFGINVAYDEGGYGYVHPKQCRRLRAKKKERREWWICTDRPCSCEHGCDHKYKYKCVRVREVKAAK